MAALWVAAPLPDRLSSLAWGSLAFQTVVVSFASYLVWFWLIRHYPATPLASFTMLTPVFAHLGAVLLAEPVTARLLIALATVAAGIFRQPPRAMTRIATIALRLAVCAGISWAVWRWFGLSTMVPTLGLFGILLARPLLDLAGALRDGMKQVQLSAVEGRHYAFRGRRVHVLEDADRRRWVRLADVRAIVGFTASDGALAITYPDGVRRLGQPRPVGERCLPIC